MVTKPGSCYELQAVNICYKKQELLWVTDSYICYLDKTSKREDESLVNFEVTLPYGLYRKHTYRSRTEELIIKLAF